MPLPRAVLNGSEATIISPYAGAVVRYTLDGCDDPDSSSSLYRQPFELPQGAVLMNAFLVQPVCWEE